MSIVDESITSYTMTFSYILYIVCHAPGFLYLSILKKKNNTFLTRITPYYYVGNYVFGQYIYKDLIC